MTGADSAEMGQGGMRVNMVPKDGGNTFRGTVVGNFANERLRVGQLQLAGHRPGLHAVEPLGRSHLQPEQQAHQRQPDPGRLGLQPVDRRADHARPALVQLHVPPLGREQDRWPTATPTSTPRPSATPPDFDNPASTTATSSAMRPASRGRSASKDKISYYHDNQRKYRDHWGIAANVPPEAAGVQVTPTSFVSVTKWTRTHTNRLLLEGGLGIYDQNYTELYQPSVTGLDDKVFDLDAIRNARDLHRLRSGDRQDRQRLAAPADHYSLLRTFMGAASYVTGSHSFRFGASVSRRRLARDDRLHRRHAADHVQRRQRRCPRRCVCRSIGATASRPTPASSSRIAGRWAGSRGTSACATTGSSARRRRAKCSRAASTPARHFGKCADGKNDPRAGCTGDGPELEGPLAARRLRARRLRQRPDGAQGELRPVRGGPEHRGGQRREPRDGARPDRHPRLDRRCDRQRAAARRQRQHPVQRARAVDRRRRPSGGTSRRRRYDPEVLNGWGKRGYNYECVVRGAAPAGRSRLAERRLTTAGRSATRPSPTTCATTRAATIRSASPRRRIRTCPTAAAATRSAASWT